MKKLIMAGLLILFTIAGALPPPTPALAASYNNSDYMFSPMFGYYGTATIGAATKYGNVASHSQYVALQTSESLVQELMPDEGWFSDLNIFLVTAPGGSETVVVTLRVNAVDTALHATITGAGTQVSSGSTSVKVLPGDMVSYKVVSSAATAAGLKAYVQYQSATDNYQVILGARRTDYANGSRYGLTAKASSNTSIPIPPMPVAGTFKNIYANAAADFTFTIGIDGTDTALVVSAIASGGTFSTAADVHASVGQHVDVKVTGSTTNAAYLSYTFKPDTPGFSIYLETPNAATFWTTGNGNYYGLNGANQAATNTGFIKVPAGTFANFNYRHYSGGTSETTQAKIYKNTTLTLDSGSQADSSGAYTYPMTGSITTIAGDNLALWYSSSYTTATNFNWSFSYFQALPANTAPRVITSAAVVDPLNQNKVIVSGMVKSMGTGTNEQTFFLVSFEFGTSTSYGTSIAAIPNRITAPGVAGFFQGTTPNLAQDITYHYRAKAVGNTQTVYGDDKTFMLQDITTSNIQTQKAYDVKFDQATFGAYLYSLGNNSVVDIYIQVGQTTTYALGDTLISGNVTTEGLYEATLGGLATGTRYHYRAKGIGDNSTMYGEDLFLNTDDPAKSTWVNDINNWFESIGWQADTAWWLILVLLVLLVFLMFFRLGKPGIIAAIIIDGMIIGFFLAAKLIDIWLVILLALVAAAVIFALVFRSRGVSE